MAMLTGAIIASAETDSESSLARRAGVTRVTVGPDFVVSITGDWSKGGYSKHLTKEKVKAIADKLGGEVVTG